MGFFSKLRQKLRRRIQKVDESDYGKKMKDLHFKQFRSLYSSKVVQNALNVGDEAPIKELSNCFGEKIDLEEELKKGPVVIKFFRGTWCGYCSTDLDFMQEHYDALKEAGASTVIAVSTMTHSALSKAALSSSYPFQLVSDSTNEIGGKFGLVFTLEEELRKAYKDVYSLDLTMYHQGDGSTLTLPATYIIHQGEEGRPEISYAFLDEDFRNRAPIDEVVHFVKKARIDRKKYKMCCKREAGKQECSITAFAKVMAKAPADLLKCNKGRKAKEMKEKLEREQKEADEIASAEGVPKLPKRQLSISSSMSSLSDKDPLRYILESDLFFDPFQSYLEKTYCSENLLFFLEASDYLANFEEMKEEKRKEEAVRITETFIKTGSELEINIDDTTRDIVLKDVSNENLYAEVFAAAGLEIYRLMSSDSFSKWRKTKEFYQLWRKSGSVETISPTPDFAKAA